MASKDESLLFNKLNLETARIPWHELQRFFAQGKVLYVNQNEDLVSIAESIANDNSQHIDKLIKAHTINLVSDQQAKLWYENEQNVWAVVVAPWVLVQIADYN